MFNKLARIFNNMAPAGDTDRSVPLEHLGVDLLFVVEMRNWLAHHLKASVSVSEITQAPSLSSFTTLVAATSEPLGAVAEPGIIHDG